MTLHVAPIKVSNWRDHDLQRGPRLCLLTGSGKLTSTADIRRKAAGQIMPAACQIASALA